MAAVKIPAGTEATLADGALVQLVHELSGDYTVRTMMGTMYRIDGRNADALGLQEVKADALPVVTDGKPTDEHIYDVQDGADPEIPVNIVELGLIYRMGTQARARNQPRGGRYDLDRSCRSMGQVLIQDIEQEGSDQLDGD